MPADHHFLAAIAAAPHDRLPRLVYADWLDEHDDPRGELVRLEDGLLDIPPADDRYWELRVRRNSLRATVDADWLTAVRVGLDSMPLLAHGWPDDWKGRWRTVRAAAERLLGKDVPDVGGHAERVAEVEQELGLTLSPSLQEWVAFVEDVREEREYWYQLAFGPRDQYTGDGLLLVTPGDEAGGLLAVEPQHLTELDPPLTCYYEDLDGHTRYDEGGEPSLLHFVLHALISECHGTGGVQSADPPGINIASEQLVRDFGPPQLIGNVIVFERPGLIAYFEPPRSLRVSARSTVRREDVPPFIFEAAAKGGTLSGLFVPEGFEELLPPHRGGRLPPSMYFHDPAEMAYRRGTEYRTGNDHPQAARWFRLAADHGHANALSFLGYMHHIGQGVAPDPAEAVRLYRLASEKGDPNAQLSLGRLCRSGRGVTQDYTEALRLFHLAFTGGEVAAASCIGYAYLEGLGVSVDATEAVRWYRIGAEGGSSAAMYSLGYCHLYGFGVEKDLSESATWYQAAADRGEVAAMYKMGEVYKDGNGRQKDAEEALRWFRRAADAGHEEAKKLVAEMTGG